MTRPLRVAVIGGGIAGLAAAYDLTRAGAEVVVLEAGPVVGGKVETAPFAGVPLDCSADAFLARVPWATDLCREIGLGDELVSPAIGSAYVWKHGALRRLPAGLVLGVPTDLDVLAASGLVSPAGVARAREDLARDPDDPVERHAAETDETVGSLVRRRLGDEVFETLVDPLLSGVNAGRADELSLAAGAAQLAAAARADTSLIRALRAQIARLAGPSPSSAAGATSGCPAPIAGAVDAAHVAVDERASSAAGAAPAAPGAAASGAGDADAPGGPTAPTPPVFLTPRGGMRRIVEQLVSLIGPERVHVERPVTSLVAAAVPDGGGYVVSGPGGRLVVDRVVLATPASVTAALVGPACPAAAELLRAIRYASVALVAFAFRADDVDRPLDASGFLVPRAGGLLLTACSWSSSKFAHLGGDGVVRLRASVGRRDDDRHAALDDEALVARLGEDLAATMGVHARPVQTRVSRWPDSLPQYPPGHLGRVEQVETDLAAGLPGVRLAGAAYRGLGVPACIASGRAAARAILDAL